MNSVKSLVPTNCASSSTQFLTKRLDHTQGRDAGPHGNGHEFRPATQQEIWNLGKWIVELGAHFGLIIASQSPIPDMAHDSYYPDGVRTVGICREGAISAWDPEALPNGLLFAESELCQNVINHYDELVALTIMVIEESPLEQGDLHNLQIVRCHAACQREGRLVRRRHVRRSPVADSVVAIAHRDSIDCRHRVDSRHAACAIQNVLPSCADLASICECGRRKRHPANQHVVDIHAGVAG